MAINNLHGHLAANTPGTIQVGRCNPVPSSGPQTGWTQKTVPAGGIAYLATHIKALRSTNPNTITVGAGDLIGASPLVSALFHDEPTIEALNSLGMDVSGVGNHEFDEGLAELQRMRHGNQRGGNGCHPVDGCQDGGPFGGSLFPYLAANVLPRGHGRHHLSGLRDPQGREREDRIHRAHLRGDADGSDPERYRGPRVPAGGGHGQRTRSQACTQPLGGEVDLDAFVCYLGAHSPVAPPPLNRIEKVG